MSADSHDVPASNQPADGVSFGHFVVPRREDGSLWKLGEGNMGVTYRAFDTSLKVEVALKVITASRVNEDEARRRFQREARAAARIRHPNIASVLYLGEEGGEFFYAMEFVPGESLDALLKASGGPLPPVVAVALAAQVAAALNAAHKKELVHRDLKPANLMLLEGEHIDHEDPRTDAAGHRQVKVIDFGLARSFGAERNDDSLVTQTVSGFIGTPTYASPEQATGDSELDGRSDLYSLGIILWQMLVGRPPFTGKVMEVMRRHLFTPPPLAELPTGLPDYLVQVIAGLLAKDPGQRWPQTAGDLRNALDATLHDLTGSFSPPSASTSSSSANEGGRLLVDFTTSSSPALQNRPIGPEPADGPSTGSVGPAGTRPPRTGLRNSLVPGMLLLLLGLAIAGIWWMVTARSRAVPSRSQELAAAPATDKTSSDQGGSTPSASMPLSSAAPGQRLPGGTSGDALEQARALRQRGDMRAALSRLREALVAEPDNAQAIAEMALTYEAMQLPDKAAEQWQRIFGMGESVGALYYLADAKLHVKPAGSPADSRTADETVIKITNVDVEEIPDAAFEKKVALKIVVKSRPGIVIDPAKVRIEAHFYDLLDGKDIVQTDAQTDYAWLTPQPINWANDKSEVLEALYARPKVSPINPPVDRRADSHIDDRGRTSPKQDSVAAPLSGPGVAHVRTYLGFAVRLYYNGKLQEVQAEPVRLLQQFRAPPTL